jgi:hypothetical protein
MQDDVKKLHHLMQRKLNVLLTEPTVNQLQEGIPQLCKIGEGFFEYVKHGNGLYRKQWDVVGADTSVVGEPTYFSFYRNANVTLTADGGWKVLDFDTVTTDSDSGGVGDGSETWLPDASYIVQNGREGTYYFSASPMFGGYAPTGTGGWIATKMVKTTSDTAAVEGIIVWQRCYANLAGNYTSVPISGVFDMKGGDYVKIYAAATNVGDADFIFLGVSGSDKLSIFSGFKIGD